MAKKLVHSTRSDVDLTGDDVVVETPQSDSKGPKGDECGCGPSDTVPDVLGGNVELRDGSGPPSEPVKRKPGRPKGSKTKKKTGNGVDKSTSTVEDGAAIGESSRLGDPASDSAGETDHGSAGSEGNSRGDRSGTVPIWFRRGG